MGGGSSTPQEKENVKVGQFFKTQGLDQLGDGATKKQIVEAVLGCGEGEDFMLNQHGNIVQIGMDATDLQVGNFVLEKLQEGVGEALAEGRDPLAKMLANRDAAADFFAQNDKAVTVVGDAETERSLEVETYRLESIIHVANALLATLQVGFGLSRGLSRALVFPKIAEFVQGLADVYSHKLETVDLKEFTLQFMKVDKEMKCTSITAYRFKFSSNDKCDTKFWLFTSHSTKMWIKCRRSTFLCTQAIKMDDMFS